MLVKVVDTVEMKWLGLSTCEEIPKSPDQTQEDAFCNRLISLGADLFDDETNYQQCKARDHIAAGAEDRNKPVLETGWLTTGGVWILDNPKGQTLDLTKLHRTKNMDERSRRLEELGANFYAEGEESTVMKERKGNIAFLGISVRVSNGDVEAGLGYF